ncbi:MAG: glutamate--cysteine ligase [Prolixibacteraceae bacterium]
MTEAEKLAEIHPRVQLAEYFEKGNKPADRWGIGTEHEKFLYRASDLKRLDYFSVPGIGAILVHMQKEGWKPVTENGNIIALQKDGASISLEPGGQFELSGRNFRTVHETFTETERHFEEVKKICRKFGVFSLAIGFDPLWELDNMPWMPKERYAFMRAYMPLRGSLGLDMMTRTATIQVNLDYGSEHDMVRKMRVAQALQSTVTAIFANSPFSGGKPNGYLSYRAHVWDDTDPDRCGFLPFIFDEGFGFERYADYLMDIPMYFIVRDGNYSPARHMTFREFMSGKHELKPVMQDWETHVSTVFPDVRLKQFIEMRGADGSCVHHIASLAALWVGLLYDNDSLDESCSLIRDWDITSMLELRARVPREGLKAEGGNIRAGEVARQIIRIASEGLGRRAKLLGIENEARYLEPVREIAESGITQAEHLLHDYYREWNEDVTKLIRSWPKLHCDGPCR